MAPTLSITPSDLPKMPKPGLHRLPPEVRMLIFEYALVEPPRWHKRHRLKCEFKPKHTYELETPPFTQTRVHVVGQYVFRSRTTTSCSCAKRRGLALLRVSKAIYGACRPVFWLQNTFCFLDAVDFISVVGHMSHPKFRQQVRAVSIMDPDPDNYKNLVTAPQRRTFYYREFWETLIECRSLEKLDMPAAYIQWTTKLGTAEWLNRLAKSLPKLPSLDLNFVIQHVSHHTAHIWRHDFRVYTRCARRIPLRPEVYGGLWLPDVVSNLARDLQFNFRVHVDTAVKVNFLGATLETLSNYQHHFRLASGLDEFSNTRRITLPSGERTTVTFYGLPISAKTRRAKALLSMKEERRERRNKLKKYQKEEIEAQRELKRVERENMLMEERERHQDALVARGLRRLEIRAQEKQSQKDARKQERARMQVALKEANDSRRSGRKRVTKAGGL